MNLAHASPNHDPLRIPRSPPEISSARAWAPWESALHPRHVEIAVSTMIGWSYLEQGAWTEERERCLRWVDGIGTRSDTNRAARIEQCGRVELVYAPASGEGASSTPGDPIGLVAWRHRWCRDRACHACAIHRANEGRAGLRERLAELEGDEEIGGVNIGVTTTQVKRPAEEEGPYAASRRLADKIRRWTRSKAFREIVIGYVRAIEVVWIPRGWREGRRGPYLVQVSGWHAHAHWSIHVRDGVTEDQIEEVLGWWTDRDGAKREGLDYKRHDQHSVGQIAKYITKPFELPEHLCSYFFAEMANVRLLASAGTWRGAFKPRDSSEIYAPRWAPQPVSIHDVVAAFEQSKTIRLRWKHREEGEGIEGVRQREVISGVEHSMREVDPRLLLDALTQDRRSLVDRKEGREAPPRDRGPPPTRR